MSSTQNSGAFRSGFVALVGRPNVGKSTLLNRVLGEKVAIVSPKPQTTRTRIHGIHNSDSAQVVFVDTPGLCRQSTPLHRAMRRIAGAAALDADITLLMVDPQGADQPRLEREDRELLQAARRGSGKVLLALNKVDRIKPKQLLLPWIDFLQKEEGVQAVVPISARSGDGIDGLLAALEEMLPEGVPVFPQDLHTDQAERFLCEELVREQLLLQTHQEVPHGVAVEIESFEDLRPSEPPEGEAGEGDGAQEQDPGMCRIEGRIYVERNSHKGIVVGKGGARIKAVSTAAREEMEELLGCKVFLRLTVHVERDWTRSERGVRRFGLDGGEHG